MIHHTKSTRCPICAGAQTDPHGKGLRCFGFTSDDGQWVRCTRENFAGSLPRDEKTHAFVHRFGGPCNCGVEHAPANGNGHGSIHKPIILATYEYRDEKDRPLYRVLRFLPKDFRPERWDPKANAWAGGQGCMEGVRRVPYRLPEILEMPQDQPILILDGEKDVDTSWAIGQPATCSAGGMKWTPELVAALGGRPITIIADRDGGRGKEQADHVARLFETAKVKHRVIELPGEGVKDLTDFVHKAGGTLQKLTELMEGIVNWRALWNAKPVTHGDIAHLVDEPIPYVVKPVLVRGSLTQIQGIPKGGKSAFALYLALAGAICEWKFPQYLVADRPLRILYLAWEDPDIMMAKRLSLYAVGLGFERTFTAPPENLKFLFAPDIFIEQLDHAAALKACIREFQADVVIIDTLSHIHLCDENASSEMKIPMKNLARVARDEAASILYIHHTGKGSGEKLTQDKGRGSGAIAAAWHVLIDWGIREKGSNVNPIEIQSKYEHKYKFWDVNYQAIEDEFENVTSVSWSIEGQDKSSKPKGLASKDKKIARLTETFKKLHEVHDWVTSLQVTNTCNLGLDERSVRRHLRTMCEDGGLECKSVSPNPADPLHYRIAPSKGNLSGTDYQ